MPHAQLLATRTGRSVTIGAPDIASLATPSGAGTLTVAERELRRNHRRFRDALTSFPLGQALSGQR